MLVAMTACLFAYFFLFSHEPLFNFMFLALKQVEEFGRIELNTDWSLWTDVWEPVSKYLRTVFNRISDHVQSYLQ